MIEVSKSNQQGGYMNDITFLLNIEDDSIHILDTWENENTKYIELEKKLCPRYCPSCGYRMHSKGIKIRTINHSMLQDGYTLKLILHQRRWICSNPECRTSFNDDFSFVQKGKRVTNLLPFMMIDQLKDLTNSIAAVAKRFHVSDTYVHDTFSKYVDMKRLPYQKYYALMKFI